MPNKPDPKDIIWDESEITWDEPKPAVSAKPAWQTPMDEMIMNIPSSAGNYIKTLVKGIASMPEMAKNALPSNPQELVNRMSDAGDKTWDKVVLPVLKNRYGSVDNILNTLKTDPVGVLADVSMIYAPADPTRAITGTAKAAGKALTETLPKWSYKSAVKMGTGKALSVAERNKRAITGLEEAILPTEGGLSKLEGKIGAIEEAIQTPVTEAAQRGVTVPRQAVAGRLEDTMEKFTQQVNPLDDLNAIANVEKGFVETQPSRIPIDVAQKLKKGTYQQLKGKYGKLSGAAIESEKALARGLKEEVYSALEATHPELKALGEKEGSLLALKDSIENAVKRIQNQEAIGLGMPAGAGAGYAMGGSTGAATAGFLAKALELPRVKSALAVALYKAGKASKKLSKPAAVAGKLPPYAYATGQYLQEE